MKLITLFRSPLVLGIGLLLCVLLLGTGVFSQFNSKAIATAPGIPPELRRLSPKSFLLTWTDDSAVYVACYPTIKPQMKPAPIQQTPNRYVLTCKN